MGDPEKVVVEEVAPEPKEPEKPTMAELADAGLNEGEIEMAKRQGVIESEEGDDKGDETQGDSSETTDEADPSEADGNGASKSGSQSVDDRFRVLVEGRQAEKVIEEISGKTELTPDQESLLLANLSNNGKNLYWAQKHERRMKQKVTAERDDAKEENERLRKENEELRNARQPKTQESEEDDDPLNLNGKPKNDKEEKKFLTEEDLDKREKEKQTKLEADEAKRRQRAEEVTVALNDHQAEARSRLKDFDAVTGKAAEIMEAANAGKLAEMYPDARVRSKVARHIESTFRAFALADQFQPGEYNPADYVYDLGMMFPTKKADAQGKTNKGETDRDGNPENAKRAIENASRRGSSASLGGGSRREVSLDELTPEQASRMSQDQWANLPQATRERLLGK